MSDKGNPAPQTHVMGSEKTGEVHLKLVDDHMPEDVSELIDYLREMACVCPNSGERQMPTAVDDAAFDMAAAALEKMQDALRQIENPIEHFRQMAADEGAGLDGVMVVTLANDAEYLKGIARSALAHLTPSTQSRARG